MTITDVLTEMIEADFQLLKTHEPRKKFILTYYKLNKNNVISAKQDPLNDYIFKKLKTLVQDPLLSIIYNEHIEWGEIDTMFECLWSQILTEEQDAQEQ